MTSQVNFKLGTEIVQQSNRTRNKRISITPDGELQRLIESLEASTGLNPSEIVKKLVKKGYQSIVMEALL